MLRVPPTTTVGAHAFTTVYYTGNSVVRLVTKLRCPHCRRELKATDIDLDFGDVHLICRGCHRDVLVIGAAS
jgi:hypothetical protein